MDKRLIFFLSLLLSTTLALSESEEQRLIFGDATDLIDEKLRELPGGVLVPPEVRMEPVPKMAEEESELKPILQFDTFGGGGKNNKDTTTTRRLQAYSSSSSFLHHKKSSSSPPKSRIPEKSSTTTLEIALKRIEILASRAGFNMSSVPRRSQLQIVTRIAEKLPSNLKTAVKTALISNDKRIYEYLPEPGRDPLIEDNPEFLRHFLRTPATDDDDELERRPVVVAKEDTSGVSISTDGVPPSNSHHDVWSEMHPPEEILGSFSEPIEERVANHKTHRIKTTPTANLRVSIISKDDFIPTTTPPPPQKIKYVQVTNNNSNTNPPRLFQVESQDYDLTSSEIEAMVEELEKDKVNEIDKPHPLEYPDHPEHDELRLLEGRIAQKKKNSNNNRRPQNFNSRLQRPVLQRPINDVKVKEAPKEFNRECDYFSNELCLLVQDYPIEAISDAIESNPSLTLSLLPREDSTPTNQNQNLQTEGGFLCPSKVAYGKVKKAKSQTTNKWKFIVNYGDKTQTLRIEKCLTPGERCSYVQHHYRTACTQVYNYHRLLAWDHERGLHVDVFKVPTVCTCHVQGYYSPPPNQSPAPPPLTRRHFRHNQQQRPHFRPPMMMHHHHRLTKPEVRQQHDDQELTDLLKQYNALRDKIAMKSQKDDSLNIRKKRKNKPENKPLKKILKKMLDKKKSKKTLLRVAKELMRLKKEKKEMKKLRIGRGMLSEKKSQKPKLEKLVRYLKKKRVVKVKSL